MNESYVSDRIAKLRTSKNVSARDMSLSIGQNENYINHIENKKTYPSMQAFFYICEYFNISPKDFFDERNTHPALLYEIIDDLNDLDETQLKSLHQLIQSFKK